MGSRKDIENHIVSTLSLIDKTGVNGDMYRKMFKSMSNKEFEAYMLSLKNEEAYINIVIPPLSDIEKGITVESNIKAGKAMGVNFFQKLTYGDDGVTSNIPVMVGYGLFRRVKQTAIKGISVPKDNKSRNTITNESSGKSKGSKVTLPESDILLGHKLKSTMKELLNVRGGDLGANTAMLSEISKQGKVKQSVTDRFRTGTGAKNVVSSIFRAMHIDMKL